MNSFKKEKKYKKFKRHCRLCGKKVYSVGPFCRKDCEEEYMTNRCRICFSRMPDRPDPVPNNYSNLALGDPERVRYEYLHPFTVQDYENKVCHRSCRDRFKENPEIYGSERFCSYENCHSGLFAALHTKYCSIFCCVEQEKVNSKRAKIVMYRAKPIIEDFLKTDIENVKVIEDSTLIKKLYDDIEIVERMKIPCPPYYGEIEHANNLLNGFENPK